MNEFPNFLIKPRNYMHRYFAKYSVSNSQKSYFESQRTFAHIALCWSNSFSLEVGLHMNLVQTLRIQTFPTWIAFAASNNV